MNQGLRVITRGCAMVLIAATVATDSLRAQTYYVDNTSEPASCPGAGTSQNPYCSILTALAQIGTGKAGKTVVVRPGKGYYREFVDIQAIRDSGAVSVGNVIPFVLKAEGTVLIDGSDVVTTWVLQAGTTIWRSDIAPPTAQRTVRQSYHAGIRYPSWVGVSWQSLPIRRCIYVQPEGAVYLNYGPGPLVGPVNVSLRVPIRVDASNVTVDGFTIRRSTDDGILIRGGAAVGPGVRNVTVKNCDVRDSRNQGISFESGRASHHSTISDNISCANGESGIYLPTLVTDCNVLRNTSASNADPLPLEAMPYPGRTDVCGIFLGSGSVLQPNDHNHLVEGNNVYGNQDTGIEIRTNKTTLRYNRSWSNQDHGYDHLYCRDVSHIGDLAWGNNRDGMSFESGSYNHSVRNCVMANNGRDRCRNDWELEVYTSAQVGWSSSHNVIWRDPVNETGDNQIINFQGGPQLGQGENPQCLNGPCTNPLKCFTTMSGFASYFPGHAVGSVDAQPVFADSGIGIFIPLSNSSIVDAGNANVAGYLPTDVRGYYRHDAQAREPNTGIGMINYADVGPYEFDAGETPTAPSASAVAGRNDIVVSWPSTQYNGDESSWYQVLLAGIPVAFGTQAPAGGSNCAHLEGLSECTTHSIVVNVYDINTGYSSFSATLNPKTKCSGNLAYECGYSGFASGGEESLGAEFEGAAFSATDEPKRLDVRVATLAGRRAILYSVPRDMAGAPLDLGVFDVAGRRVLTVEHGRSRVGRFSADLDRSRAGMERAGVYFIRLRVGSEMLRRTLVLW